MRTAALQRLLSLVKGGERLGDEESSEEEKEVTPASILRRGRGHSLPTLSIDLPKQIPLEIKKNARVNNDLGRVQGDG